MQIAGIELFLIITIRFSIMLARINVIIPATINLHPAYKTLLPAVSIFIKANPIFIAGKALPHNAQVKSARTATTTGLVKKLILLF